MVALARPPHLATLPYPGNPRLSGKLIFTIAVNIGLSVNLGQRFHPRQPDPQGRCAVL